MTTSGPLGLAGPAPVDEGAGESLPPGGGGLGRSPLMRWASPLVAIGLLFWTARRIDLALALQRLGGAEPGWLVLAFAASAPPVLLSAWRWRYTAGRLGLSIAWGWAWREYYVAILLNQVLPGGVLGDVVRALRHRHSLGAAFEAHRATAAKAVVFERASNQFVVWSWAIALAPFWVGGGAKAWAGWPVLALALLALAGAFALARGRFGAAGSWAERVGRAALRDLWQVFGRRASGLVHVTVSLIIFAQFGAVFWCASAAVGAPLAPGLALRIVPLVLVASSVPLTPSGWGVREAMAAALYGAAGLEPAAGAAASVLYGLVSLAATLPGALFLAVPHRQSPGAAP
ncbi:MAG TPA: lysylphosphatidylglycerol synthase transmembrane domain-containing protein [Polyangiaceae bacterium]|nr:lysylphosphatidylglycerol synthase transmembrane domain-containing protein [Polyangiaceae bacterium]